MKKAKVRTGTTRARAASPVNSAGRPAPELAEIRRHIADIVGNGAVGMVETTIDQVGKGHYLGMKYLFEMVGLYPATATDDYRRRIRWPQSCCEGWAFPMNRCRKQELPKIQATPLRASRIA